MNVRWKLRMAAAQREVWTGADLRRLLAERAGVELSAASVSALLTKQPSQVKLTTLAALCTALECTPDDLFDIDTTPVVRPVAPAMQIVPFASWSAICSPGLAPGRLRRSTPWSCCLPCKRWKIAALWKRPTGG